MLYSPRFKSLQVFDGFLVKGMGSSMKKITAFLVFCLLFGMHTLSAQGVSCPAVVAEPDTTLPCASCVTLEATPVSGFTTTDYSVGQIPYVPYSFTQGTQILINIDDIYSSTIPIGFDFCFYGNSYNQLNIGSNGIITFDLTNSGQVCPWPINNAIPSPLNPTNSIMAPWHDIDPSIAGSVRWATYGTAPCRVFVVTWANCAMFSCNNLIATQQIAIYETTNVIETYIANKPTCSAWNSGAAIHGIQNATGTMATVVPGRNYPALWTASMDAWAFTPSGAPNYSVEWFEAGQTVPFANTDTATVCPTSPTDYIAVATYLNCNGDTVIVSDTASVQASGNPGINLSATTTDVSCFGASDGTATVNISGGSPPYTIVWSSGGTNPTETGLAAGTYTVAVTDTTGCPSTLQVTINEPDEIVASALVQDASCFGFSDGSINVSATGGDGNYTYSWTPNVASGATGTNLAAGFYSIVVTDGNGCDDTVSATITQPPAINTVVQTVDVSCAGGSDGTATAAASGGQGTFTYLWQPGGQTTPVAINLSGGPIAVIVTDSAGCQDTATAIINNPPPIGILVSTISPSCFGGSDGSATATAIGGTGNLSFSWSPGGATTATATGLSAGVYTVVVSDDNGCSDSISVGISEPAPVTASLFSTNESCFNNCDGSVSAVPQGGTTPYSYQWDTPNGDTSSTVQGLCNGTYTLTVTDANGCTVIDSVEIGFPQSPVADAGPDLSFCEGEGGVTLQPTIINPGGGAPLYYTWTCNNSPCGLSCVNCQNPIANPTDTTVYYLVVTDQNGCGSLVDSMVVNVVPKPVVDAGPDETICGPPSPGTVLQPTVTGFGPYTYNWIPSAGLNNPNIPNPAANPDTTTIYTLVVTDLATGCTSDFTTTDTNSTVTINVNPTPIAEAGPDMAICFGDTTQLQATGTGAGPNYQFQWSPGSSLSNPATVNPLAWPAFTTEYILTVFSNGCPSFGDTVRVTVNPIPTVDAGPDRDYCFGGSAQLDAVVDSLTFGTGFAYSWTPGATLSDSTIEDPIAFPDQTTVYYITATSPQGCESEPDSVTVTIRPTPLPDAGPTQTLCLSDSTLQLNGTINWANNQSPSDQQNLNISWAPASHIVGPVNVVNPVVAPDSSMWFYFTVTFDSCTNTDSVLINVIPEINAMAAADTTVICGTDSTALLATGGIGGASFTWTPPAGLSDPNSANPMASPDSTTTYSVIVQEGGCSDTAEITLQVIPKPEVAFVNSFNEGCVPLEVSFTALTSDAINYIWNFGDGSEVDNTDAPFHTYATPGTYTVTLYGVNFGGCIDSSSATTVTVYDTISADFTSDPIFPVEMVIPGTEVQFTDLTTNANMWNWSFGNGISSTEQNPSYLFQEPGEYMVTLTTSNEFGCMSEVTHGPYIVIIPELFIPNVFSPNADGINDVFLVEYNGNQVFEMTVFDRWGAQVYQTRNKVQGWEGVDENGSEVPAGSYYYRISVGDKDYAGNITLVR